MDPKAGVWLVAPSVRNASCSHPRYTAHSLWSLVGPVEALQALLVFSLAVGIIGANLMVILVINNRRYSSYIQPQPRYLLTSLALNDLAIGVLITPFGVVSALFHCWAFGEVVCQIQALLRGALSQQSAVILVCMAIDRYLSALHPNRYHQHSSKKGCVVMLSFGWIACLTVFGMLVLPKGYYYNSTGLLACEPFYSRASFRILATCALYFPTTMVLMYCYGSSFHTSRLRLTCESNKSPQEAPEPQTSVTIITEKPPHSAVQERHVSGSTSRTMAAMSLGFIVMVTPWTIQEIVAACTGSKVPPFLDFFVTWTAISNSFWNPFLYWLLNAHFRRIGREFFTSWWCTSDDPMARKSRCCSVSSECDPISLPVPPAPPKSQPPRPDIEGMSEKYWGEILERTVSSTSLHALQRAYAGRKSTSFGSLNLTDLEVGEHTFHAASCARNKILLEDPGPRHTIKGLPDI
ncbi:trace amine-associated receptor 1 [Phlebotomus argentipes]|uniref:trace amine-associated receptor 1 n=1 Tax=Phlebotomus argentipes TaxID=94469 RepID=UPI002892E79B|nr:trace amine-associated receptor 1 [Phlebotomus argentipes]